MTQSRENESVRVQELEKDKLRKKLCLASQDITNQRKILNLKCTKKRLLDPENEKKHQIICRKNMDKGLQDPKNKIKNQITSWANCKWPNSARLSA